MAGDEHDSDPASADEPWLREMARAPAEPVLIPGAIVAEKYRLDEAIGEGGMGMVWAATHTITGGTVALKFLKHSALADEQLRARFLREARVASRVEHPALVPVRDVVDTEDGAQALVMDLLHGETLGDRIDRDGALPPARAARLVLDVADALAAVHAAGLVHRDLKPDNIFLEHASADDDEAAERVRLLDFGIAKHSGSPESNSIATTADGTVFGTPAYMSPEQAFGDGVDERSDIWALGAILYECLSGERFVEATNVGAAVKAFTVGSLRVQLPSAVPAELARLVERMLVVDREERIAELDAVRAELDEVIRRCADEAAPAQSRGLWIVVLLAAIALLAVGAWLLLS